MKRLLAAAFAVVLVFVLASGVLAAGPFAEEDGYIVGTYEADGFIEIRVNDMGVGAGIGSVTIKTPALGNGQDHVEIYVDGALAEAYVGDEPVEDFSQVEKPVDDIVPEDPAPTPEVTEAPAVDDEAGPDGATAPGADNAAAADEGSEAGSTTDAEEPGGLSARNILLIVAAVVVVAAVVTVIAIRGKKDGKNEQE